MRLEKNETPLRYPGFPHNMLRRISWLCAGLCVIRLGMLRFDDTAGAETRRPAQIDVQQTSINRFLTTPTGSS